MKSLASSPGHPFIEKRYRELLGLYKWCKLSWDTPKPQNDVCLEATTLPIALLCNLLCKCVFDILLLPPFSSSFPEDNDLWDKSGLFHC